MPPDSKLVSIVLALFALCWGTYWAHHEQQSRTLTIDLDGWARVTRYGYSNADLLRQLVVNPSLWKGPIVPAVYGIATIFIGSIYTPIGVNILAFALTVGMLHRLIIVWGGRCWPALLAMIGWIVYPPFRSALWLLLCRTIDCVIEYVTLCVRVDTFTIPDVDWFFRGIGPVGTAPIVAGGRGVAVGGAAA